MDGMEKDFSNPDYQKYALILGVTNYNFHQKFTVNDNTNNCISIESSPKFNSVGLKTYQGSRQFQ